MKSNKSLIFFIIISYTTDQDKLDVQLKSLEGYSVIIIKNDATKLHIPKKGYIKVIQNSTNLGFGGGANVGIEYALKHGANWIVILNDDIFFTKKTLSQFYTIISSCDNTIVGPYAGFFDKYRYSSILKTDPIKVIPKPEYISGSFMAIRSDVFSRIGYFYEPYFLYYEDADFCVRARNAGFSIAHVSLPDLQHTDAERYKRDPQPHDYYLARNHMLFVFRQAPISVKLHELIRLPKTLFEHYRMYRTGAIQGIADFSLQHFGKKTFV